MSEPLPGDGLAPQDESTPRHKGRKQWGHGYHSGLATAGGGVVGNWFHSFDAEGELKWQGQIVAREGEMLLVQLYDWMDGEPSRRVLVSPKDIADWHLYRTNREMHIAYYRKEYNRLGWCGRERYRRLLDGKEGLTDAIP